MKRGFLLGAPRDATRPPKGGPAKPDGPPGGIKRGFLLSDSSDAGGPVAGSKETRKLPQCRSETSPDAGEAEQRTRPKRRVATTSSALLDLEETPTGIDSRLGQPSHTEDTVASMLRLVGDEPDNLEGDATATESGTVHGDGSGVPLLDSLIGTAAAEPSIALPSTSAQSQRKPLILEVESPPLVRDMPDDSNHSATPAKPADAIIAEVGQSARGSEPTQVEDTSSQEVPNPRPEAKCAATRENSLWFGNEASLVLSRLRRSLKTKSRRAKETSSQYGSVFGFGALVNEQSETLIKSFLSKQLRERATMELHLANLWQIVLGPIAQDYTERMHSRKKTKGASKMSLSPSLALSLGAVETVKPAEAVFDSLARVLLDATDSRPGVNEEQRKEHKVLALGCVYLLRCRIRCLGMAMTNIEQGSNEGVSPDLKDIEAESGLLLQKILPALEKIVSGDASGRQTVLMSSAADACFELLEMSSRVIVLRHMLSLRSTPAAEDANAGPDSKPPYPIESMLLWRDALPRIEKLVAVKRRWATRHDKPNKTDDETDGKTAQPRLKCAKAILDDWLDAINTSRRLFFDQIVGDDLHEGSNIAAGLYLFWNLAGISFMRQKDDDTCNNVCFRVGGIAQSLCQNQECNFGSFIGPIHDLGGSAEAEDLVSLLQESATMTDSIRDARKTGQSSQALTKLNHQRATVRAFGSWLSKGTKAVRILTKSAKGSNDAVGLLGSAMNSLVVLLRSESKPCVDMAIAALSMLWGASPNLLPEQSFPELLDALHTHSSKSILGDANGESSDEAIVDPTSRALCVIVARVTLQNPTMLLPQLLKMKGRKEIFIEVVLSMLEELPGNLSSEDDDPHQTVFDAATSMLLQNIESVPYLRSRLRSNPALYVNVPGDIIVPWIAEYLVGQYTQRQPRAGASALSGLLCNIMKANADRCRADAFVRCVISSLLLNNEAESDENPDGAHKDSPGTTFCNKNGPLWRAALLEGAASSKHAYRDAILAAAKSMMEMPTSGIPLALLASLVDTNYDPGQSGEEIEQRVLAATLGIMRLSADQIALSRKSDIVNEETIFGRLAPLLILRRMPRSYYRAVHKHLSTGTEAQELITRLATVFTSSLKLYALNNDQSKLAREENKLIAELAGHCLPLSRKSIDAEESPASLFEDVCREPFSGTLGALRGNDRSKVCTIVEAKAALYAISHALPLALDEENGEAVLDVSSFVLEVLNYQPGLLEGKASEQDGSFYKEISMLQSGCTHFLAVALDSLSGRKAKTFVGNGQAPLIEELGCPGTSDETEHRSADTILDALSKMFHMLQSITRTGRIGWASMYGEFYSLLQPNADDEHAAIQFSPASRMARLNSIVMLSQSSRAEDRRLDWLASNVLPPLTKWASGPMDDDIHHPLCVAAALQVVYTLLARCGSFDWLSSCPISEADFICSTLRCALRSFHASEGDGPSLDMLRLAALKVMLATIALTQEADSRSEEGLRGYLTTAEAQRAMVTLRGAANVDENPEIRRLAYQVLPYLS